MGGWKKDFIEKNTPVLPISGWMGDNLLKKSDNMSWWKGMNIECGKETIMCETMYDVLDKLCRVPERPISAPMRMPISGIYKIKGVGDVLAGRVEQGQVKPGEEVVFLPTHTSSNPCTGKVFTVEMHHSRALRTVSLPHLKVEVEDGERDRRKEDGRSAFFEVERNGTVQFPTATTTCVRHFQELRGPFSCCIHGRKWRCDVGKSYLMRT